MKNSDKLQGFLKYYFIERAKINALWPRNVNQNFDKIPYAMTPKTIDIDFDDCTLKKIEDSWLEGANYDSLNHFMFEKLREREEAMVLEIVTSLTGFRANYSNDVNFYRRIGKIYNDDYPGKYLLVFDDNVLGLFYTETSTELSKSHEMLFFFNPQVKEFE